MSLKFSFVIEVKKDGVLSPTAFLKEDAQDAIELFNKLREQGKEAYFFHHPHPDKRCKSAEQTKASEAAPQVIQDVPKPASTLGKKNTLGGAY